MIHSVEHRGQRKNAVARSAAAISGCEYTGWGFRRPGWLEVAGMPWEDSGMPGVMHGPHISPHQVHPKGLSQVAVS